jgi:hypothetical protein
MITAIQKKITAMKNKITAIKNEMITTIIKARLHRLGKEDYSDEK